MIQWLEWFYTHGKSRQFTISVWRKEMQKTRKYGPPSSRTFAAAPFLDESSAERAASQHEVKRGYEQLVLWTRRLVVDLEAYLKKLRKSSNNGRFSEHSALAAHL
jgi:hypothetical protein